MKQASFIEANGIRVFGTFEDGPSEFARVTVTASNMPDHQAPFIKAGEVYIVRRSELQGVTSI